MRSRGCVERRRMEGQGAGVVYKEKELKDKE